MNATTWLHVHTHTMTELMNSAVLQYYNNYRTWLEGECGPSFYIIFTFGIVSRIH